MTDATTTPGPTVVEPEPGSDAWHRAEAERRADRLTPSGRELLDRMVLAVGIGHLTELPPRAQSTLVWLADFTALGEMAEGLAQLVEATTRIVRAAQFEQGYEAGYHDRQRAEVGRRRDGGSRR